MLLLRAFWAVLARELRLIAGSRGGAFQGVAFYGLVVATFPLGAAPNDPALGRFAAAVVWVAALLAGLLTAERLFRPEVEDGTLEQARLNPLLPLPLWCLAKVAAHWAATVLPLIVLGPVAGALLGLPTQALGTLALGLGLGTPVLVLMAAFAGALTVGLPRAGVLLPLLVLPLLVPVLVFGAGAVRLAAGGEDAGGALYALAALGVAAVTLLPLACAGALRAAVDG